jgi:L-lactate dehydrogenase (cytochrome)
MGLSMETMTCIEDLRQAASRKVPRAFFDFVDGGSYTERTLRIVPISNASNYASAS